MRGIYKRTEQGRRNMSLAAIGKHKEDQQPQWKGEKASYIAIHQWVTRWKGKPSYCENCGTTNAKKYEWANIDHKYKRVLEDYVRMCTSCHRKYDIEHNNYIIGANN